MAKKCFWAVSFRIFHNHFFFRLIHYIASKHEFDQREEGGSGEQKNGTNGTTENGVKENGVVDDKEENEEEKVLICGEKEKNRESLECDKMTGSSVSEGDSAMSQVNIAVRFILNIAVRFILTLQDVFFLDIAVRFFLHIAVSFFLRHI